MGDLEKKKEDSEQELNTLKGKTISFLTLDPRNNIFKLIRNQRLIHVTLNRKYENIFSGCKGVKSFKVDEVITFTFKPNTECKNGQTLFIDNVSLSRKGKVYTLITILGPIKSEFPKIKAFTSMKNIEKIPVFQAEPILVLQELLRMNGFDELIKDFDSIKINIKPGKNKRDELILYTQFKYEPIKNELEKRLQEFSDTVEVYKHFLMYILDDNWLKKHNKNVYSGINESKIFSVSLYYKEQKNILLKKQIEENEKLAEFGSQLSEYLDQGKYV